MSQKFEKQQQKQHKKTTPTKNNKQNMNKNPPPPKKNKETKASKVIARATLYQHRCGNVKASPIHSQAGAILCNDGVALPY